MPKKPSSYGKSRVSILTGALLSLVLLGGLVAAYLSSQTSQDKRSDASVKNGLATISIDSTPAVAGQPATVDIYLESEVNLEKVVLKGKFEGVPLENAYYESALIPIFPVPTVSPWPETSSTPAPTATPEVTAVPVPTFKPMTPRPRGSNKPIPSTNNIMIDGKPVLGVSDETDALVSQAMTLEKNNVNTKEFELSYKLSDKNNPLPPQSSRLLLGKFILTPVKEKTGTLIIKWKAGNSKANIYKTGQDTLNHPKDAEIPVQSNLVACPLDESTGMTLCPETTLTCKQGQYYQPGPTDSCGCQAVGKCVRMPSGSPAPSCIPLPACAREDFDGPKCGMPAVTGDIPYCPEGGTAQRPQP